jgi:type IV secretion system protein VirB2
MVRATLRSVTQCWELALVVIAWSALPEIACAQASPFQTGANSLVTNVIAIATPFAVLAIMVLAVVAMTGRLSWGWPLGALIGIGVLFGAPQIVAWVRGLFGV